MKSFNNKIKSAMKSDTLNRIVDSGLIFVDGVMYKGNGIVGWYDDIVGITYHEIAHLLQLHQSEVYRMEHDKLYLYKRESNSPSLLEIETVLIDAAISLRVSKENRKYPYRAMGGYLRRNIGNDYPDYVSQLEKYDLDKIVHELDDKVKEMQTWYSRVEWLKQRKLFTEYEIDTINRLNELNADFGSIIFRDMSRNISLHHPIKLPPDFNKKIVSREERFPILLKYNLIEKIYATSN